MATKIPLPKLPKRKKPVLKLVANIEDQADDKAYLKFRFRKEGGGWATHIVSRSTAMDIKSLGKELADKNADLPKDADERSKLLAEVSRSVPPVFQSCAAKVGWVDGERAFVRHTGVAGNAKCAGVLRPPVAIEVARHCFKIKGSLKKWKRSIAQLLRWSSRLQLVSAAVFAAPLLQLVKLQPFTIIIFGESSVGKSSAVLVAGSILGFGEKDEIPNWNLTMSGFQETACRFNDHAFLIDETGAAEATKEQLYDLMRRVTYAYAEGADKLRNTKSGMVVSKERSEARGILITTSEHSLDKLAAIVGKRRDAGEAARAVNVPALSSGKTTIFDRFPEKVMEEKRSEWIANNFKAIRETCSQQHGTAFKAYIGHLVGKDAAQLNLEVEQAMTEFADALALKSEVKAVGHAARNFGIIYAGGVQALEAGLIPVSKEHLLRSIISCFNDSLSGIGLPSTKEAEGEAFAELLSGLSKTNLPRKSEVKSSSIAGFWREADELGGIRFAVKPENFAQWFSTGERCATALRWLAQRNLLLLTDGSSLPPVGSALGAAVSFEKITTADGKRLNKRWIRFLDPRTHAPD